MPDQDGGKRFLELIDEQNNLQWKIVGKLAKLIKSDWDSDGIKRELQLLVKRHEEITKKLSEPDGVL